jgi:hypothetical protein
MASIFLSRFMTLLLATLAPLIFLLAQNSHMYSIVQIVASVVFVIFFSSILFGIGTCCVNYVRKYGNRRSTKTTIFNIRVDIFSLTISIIIFIILLLYYCILFIRGCAHLNNTIENVLLFSLILFIFGLGYSAIRSPVARVFIVVFLLISMIRLVFNITRDSIESRSNHSIQMLSQHGLGNIVFTKKPNIYLFLLESFHSLDVLKNVYGIDTLNFVKELKEQGVTIYDSVYSNYTYTLFSTASIFKMDHSYYYGARGNMDVMMDVRRLLSGMTFNPVLNILKQNGYRIAYILSSNYFFMFKSKNIDYTNLKFPLLLCFRTILDISEFIGPPMRLMFIQCPGFRKKVREIVGLPIGKSTDTTTLLANKKDLNTIQELMANIDSSAGEKPIFRLIYWIGAAHTNSTLEIEDENAKNRYKLLWKEYYGNLIRKSEIEMIDAVRLIKQRDTNALIVLIGDHGSWLNGPFFRKQVNASLSPNELEQAANHYSISMPDLAKDVSSVFLGISWPNGVRKPGKQIISHVNLFRYIFSALAEDPSLMKKSKSNASYLLMGSELHHKKVFQIVQDGTPLEKWVEVEPNTKKDP